MAASRTVVVLGANAFSGQDFIDLLLDDARNMVIGVSRSRERSAFMQRYRSRQDLSRFRFYQMDMNRDLPALFRLLDEARPSDIVNFAAQSEVAPSWDQPDQWFETNTVALARLINHLRRQTYLRRYLHVSSPEVYGTCVGIIREDAPMNPSTPYAASKAAADLLLVTYARQFGFPLVTVRSTNVYGARQQLFKIIPRSAIYIRLGRRIPLHGGGRAIKSYIHVRDVSRGELAILERGQPGAIYHLSSEAGVSVRDIVSRICLRLRRSFDEAVDVTDERPGQDAAYLIDSNRARTELGWFPRVGLDEGLEEVVGWIDCNWAAIQTEALEYAHRP